MNARDQLDAGFYGKVRTHGDFVGRGLSAAFIERWDAWLQRGLLAARERYPDDWLERYLAMPVWRFSARAFVVDGSAYTGVLMPGIDAVGRYFPLVIATRIDGDLCAGDSPWHDDACALALSTLAPSFSLTSFEAGLAALRARPLSLTSCDSDSVWWTDDGVAHHQDGELDNALFIHLISNAN